MRGYEEVLVLSKPLILTAIRWTLAANHAVIMYFYIVKSLEIAFVLIIYS